MSIIKNLIKWAVVTLTDKDSDTWQRAQVKSIGENPKNIIIIYPYGLYGVAPVGSNVLMFNVFGQEENTAGIPFDIENRFKDKKDGDVIVGNPFTKSFIKISMNGDIEIEGTANINITSANEVNINGNSDALIKGNAFKTIYDAHTHTETGSVTSTPIIPMPSSNLSSKNFTG